MAMQFVARMDVRQVQFNQWRIDQLQGVEYRNRVKRKAGRVDDQSCVLLECLLNPVDHFAFVPGLAKIAYQLKFFCRPVTGGAAFAELVIQALVGIGVVMLERLLQGWRIDACDPGQFGETVGAQQVARINQCAVVDGPWSRQFHAVVVQRGSTETGAQKKFAERRSPMAALTDAARRWPSPTLAGGDRVQCRGHVVIGRLDCRRTD
jgi:hypothetical protein